MEVKMYTLGENGLEACKARPELPKGTIVHAYGGGMCYSKWAMTGNGNEIVKLSENDANDYFSYPFHDLDEYAKPIEKKFGIGFYYDLNAERATEEEITAAMKRAYIFIEKCAAAREQKQAEWDKAVADVKKKYGDRYEQQKSDSYFDAAHVAKNIRKDLAEHWAGCKFSVRKDGYDSVRVEWTDGPTKAQVEAVIGKHELISEWDKWNPDLTDHSDSPFTHVYGGVRYLWMDRHISDDAMEPLVSEILNMCPELEQEHFNSKAFELPKFNDVFQKYADAIHGMTWISAKSIAYQVLSDRDMYVVPKKSKKRATAKAESTADDIEIVDYSDRAIAVIGNTKPVAELLKQLGGRFNFRLKCGAGWIFSKKNEGNVREALNMNK